MSVALGIEEPQKSLSLLSYPYTMSAPILNPVEPSVALDVQASPSPERPDTALMLGLEDSSTTKAEKIERNGKPSGQTDSEPPAKRTKLDDTSEPNGMERQKGIAPIKSEYVCYPGTLELLRSDDGRYLIYAPGSRLHLAHEDVDDDAAEAAPHSANIGQSNGRGDRRKEKSKGQNKGRDYGSSRDEKGLCHTRALSPEFSPQPCPYGENCKYEHDLRKYLRDWKRDDLQTFNGKCPVWIVKGTCNAGWKCRFVGSHSLEKEGPDGRRELLLVERDRPDSSMVDVLDGDGGIDIINIVPTKAKVDLMKRKVQTPKTDKYAVWLDEHGKFVLQHQNQRRPHNEDYSEPDVGGENGVQDTRAQFREAPFLPSEKRRIYFGPDTPVLAPLTTQGNLPFRRLCIGFGAQLTYSEMAVSMPLIQGQKSEWALMKAHGTETEPPRCTVSAALTDYDNARDIRFGAQIAGNKPLQVMKATEVLTQLCPHLRVIDLNCGCPIDLVYRQGAGSALLDNQSKLEKMIRGMNAVSGEIPITVKIRMGTRDGKPNALKLVNRLVYGSPDGDEVISQASGVAAITLHGRSRQQRYTKSADWEYIAQCAALINRHAQYGDDLADTIREPDDRLQSTSNKVFFIGNGDCYSHVDYDSHLRDAKVDSVMIARGALMKPWIFEEVEKGQYLDKSATERLAMVESYVRYGLETWGSDEMGVGTTRRFLLEWLSFACRYVPVGILEHLPPRLQDRPPAWRGRNELETLLGSDNYKDWIKIR